ncbi:DALR anticodon-binding domain-containing protein [Actinomadura xylanilytica]|uniref:DALR anticodon-binding domain-containing protein n=1 Tax=Actinomadura xylanilytica TaxID=887459 RepID=UPI00255A8381|nr:DALR anticodon-binding domain-containing protein [Actinomadura xylanilytica]MDL4775743.1 DALR anticodon-binding domain-containing protein [Actinomadura xylanilytica]
MTPAEVGAALVAAVRDAVARGEADVPVPADVAVSCTGAGVYESPVALRLGIDPRMIAGRVGGEVTSRGFVRVRVEPGALVGRVDDAYGMAAVPPGGWAEWPRTFDNPGFAVRYAYARAGWVGRWAEGLGVRAGAPVGYLGEELELLKALGELPGRAAQAERECDARPLAGHLERLAGAYHDVHERCPALPKGDEKPGAVHAARVGLAGAARTALGNGLKMIGETPRERV